MRIKINKLNSKKRIKIQKNEKNIDKRENLVPRKINDKNIGNLKLISNNGVKTDINREITRDFNVHIKRVGSVEKIGENGNKNKSYKQNKKLKRKITKQTASNYTLLFCMTILGLASISLLLYGNNYINNESYEVFSNFDDNKMPKVDNSDITVAVKEENKNTTNTVNTQTKNTQTNTVKKVKPLSFQKPLDGEIQKIFSNDKVIYSKTLELWKTHDGIDISAPIGTNVCSIERGVIEKIYDDSFYGMTILIDHGQGYKSSYSNLDTNVSVKVNQTITKGTVIGKVSNTSIGEVKDEPHLHFMLFKDNNVVDPTYIFK